MPKRNILDAKICALLAGRDLFEGRAVKRGA
jgi:hypothetical protein